VIRIIHVSDLHLESETPSPEKIKIIDALALDIQKFLCKNSVLVFTGDLIDKGGYNFQDKSKLFHSFQTLFIDKLIKVNPSLKGKIFIVPGNHDVLRKKIDPIIETGLKNSLNNSLTLNNFIRENREDSKYLDRLEDYKKWEKQFYNEHNNITTNNFENTFVLKLNGYNVGITCLNSSWLCKDDSDENNILLGKEQIENSLKDLKGCQIKLALSHHPLYFFQSYDRDEVKDILYKHYDIMFTGHVHALDSNYEQGLSGNIFLSVANSTIGDNPKERKYVNGYTIIEMSPNDKITTSYRKYIEKHQKFVPNTDIGTEDGTKSFVIPKDEDSKVLHKKLEIINDLRNSQFNNLDDHIIISENSTDVTCSIDNLFVEPTLLNNPRNTLREKNTKKYTIDSILKSKENYLIYGARESGKTILLDKIFIEATNKFNEYVSER